MKLTKEELAAIVEAHRADSLGVEDGELTNERAVALDRYHGRPYGNEREGRSSVVSKDLSEAVDWAMPAIMRIFTQSGSVAEFDPVSPEDEQQAEIETDYVNQVIMKDNQGWVVLHDAIKDTLLLKNGYVKHWWEETEKIEEPAYQGLTIPEVQKLLSDLQADGCKVDIQGQDERVIATPQGPLPVFDLKLRIVRKLGKVRLEAVPCEEIRVSRKCRGSLQESPFVEHVTTKTRSDLIEMGMSRDFVDSLPAYETSSHTTQSLSRDSVSDETRGYGSSISDRSMDEIEYCEAYIKVDWDGDGVAELRKVVTVGGKIPDGEEWNEPIPEVALTGFTAKRVPHRHVGESIYDDLGDLQAIKTTLMRQLMDNIYLTNDNQWVVNERVNLADFMVSLPGGIKRVAGMEPVSGAVEALNSKPIVGDILPVIGFIDQVKESRTGITKASSGLDPETLSDVTKGAFMENMNRASQKIEMMTRMIAETGVKEMVLRVHSLLCRYQDKQRMVRMKGRFVPVNPQEWRERTDMTVKVGLGTGNEEDRQRKLMLIAQLQRDMLAPLGMVEAPQAFALFSDISKTLGFDMPDKYSMSPQSPEYQQKISQPPPPDPKVQADQARMQQDAQLRQMELQYKSQADEMDRRQKAELELIRQRAQQETDANRQAMEAQMHRMKLEQEAQVQALRAQYEDQRHMRELQFKQWQAELDASVRVKVADLGNQMNPPDVATAAATEEIGREVQP